MDKKITRDEYSLDWSQFKVFSCFTNDTRDGKQLKQTNNLSTPITVKTNSYRIERAWLHSGTV